eukprot:COSAG05_NODE_21296_length_273_cov_0.563218_1_plen_51_part_01
MLADSSSAVFLNEDTAYRILRSGWSSDVCAADLRRARAAAGVVGVVAIGAG